MFGSHPHCLPCCVVTGVRGGRSSHKTSEQGHQQNCASWAFSVAQGLEAPELTLAFLGNYRPNCKSAVAPTAQIGPIHFILKVLGLGALYKALEIKTLKALKFSFISHDW